MLTSQAWRFTTKLILVQVFSLDPFNYSVAWQCFAGTEK